MWRLAATQPGSKFQPHAVVWQVAVCSDSLTPLTHHKAHTANRANPHNRGNSQDSTQEVELKSAPITRRGILVGVSSLQIF